MKFLLWLTVAVSSLPFAFAQNDYAMVNKMLRENQHKKELLKTSITLLNTYYENQTHLPKEIRDGWHEVFSTNHHSFCDVRKVYVENNKITQYVVNDWRYVNIFSAPVIQAKSQVQLLNGNGSKSDLVEVFFLSSINDSNSVANPPVEPGQISFWSDAKRGSVKVYVNGKFAGSIEHYFDKDAPQCAQKGTLVYKNGPGTYSYKGVSGRSSWTGNIAIGSTDCKLVKFSK